jgi:hypothetical protein
MAFFHPPPPTLCSTAAALHVGIATHPCTRGRRRAFQLLAYTENVSAAACAAPDLSLCIGRLGLPDGARKALQSLPFISVVKQGAITQYYFLFKNWWTFVNSARHRNEWGAQRESIVVVINCVCL